MSSILVDKTSDVAFSAFVIGKMDFLMRCHKGYTPSKPPPVPPPPAPSEAAENVRRMEMFRRRRNAYGHQQTILTSPQGVSGMQSETVMKSLLGA